MLFIEKHGLGFGGGAFKRRLRNNDQMSLHHALAASQDPPQHCPSMLYDI